MSEAMLAQFSQIQKDPIPAISSGYANNCGFHSIAHLWMDLPDDVFVYLYENYPIFKVIHAQFNQEYGGGEPTLEKLLKFKKLPALNNPFDRELIWGPILRKVLRTLASAEIERVKSIETDEMTDLEQAQYFFGPKELEYLADGRCVDFRMLRLLTQEMGLDLTVYNQVASHSEYELPVYQFPPKGDICWQGELFFNGAHYDFTFGDEEKNTKHNIKRADSFLIPHIPSIFIDDKSTVKEEKKITDEKVQLAVKAIMTVVNKKLAAPQLSQETAHVKSKLNL